MREQVFAAFAGGDEAVALGVVEPLHGTGCHLMLSLQAAATNPGATMPGTTIQGDLHCHYEGGKKQILAA
jgi:hypothetical protein